MGNRITRQQLDAIAAEMDALGIDDSEQMNLLDHVLRDKGYDPETLVFDDSDMFDWPEETWVLPI